MAIHISYIKIEEFRGIQNLEIEKLSPINILVGDNNSGKTSLLEALQLFCEPTIYNLIKIARQRESSFNPNIGLSLLDSLLFLFNIKHKVQNTETYRIKMHAHFAEKKYELEIQGKEIIQHFLHDSPKMTKALNNTIPALDMTHSEMPSFTGKIIIDEEGEKKEEEININNQTIISSQQHSIIKVKSILPIHHSIQNSLSQILKDKEIKDKAVKLLQDFDTEISDIRYI